MGYPLTSGPLTSYPMNLDPITPGPADARAESASAKASIRGKALSASKLLSLSAPGDQFGFNNAHQNFDPKSDQANNDDTNHHRVGLQKILRDHDH